MPNKSLNRSGGWARNLKSKVAGRRPVSLGINCSTRMDAMAADRKARTDLRNALVRYMTGEIQTFAFDDQNSDCCRATDTSVQQISRFLWNIHDDTIDHPISVSPQGWAVLRRIVAFLDTDLEIETTQEQPAWPFHDDEEWHANEYLVNVIGLLEYDPAIHARQVHPWWNRIPSSIGFVLLGGLVVVAVILAFFLS